MCVCVCVYRHRHTHTSSSSSLLSSCADCAEFPDSHHLIADIYIYIYILSLQKNNNRPH